jgi:hypothetical protein
MGMSADELHYWERLGYPPRHLVEIGNEGESNHALGYCHRVEEGEAGGEKWVRLVCATLIFTERDEVGVFTTYSFPAKLLRRVEEFRPRKGSTLRSLLAQFKALVEGERK